MCLLIFNKYHSGSFLCHIFDICQFNLYFVSVTMKIYQVLIDSDDDDDSVELRKAQVKPFLRTFFRETSLAGIPHLVKQPGIIKKLFWLLCIVTCAYGLYWQMDVSLFKLDGHQLTTVVVWCRFSSKTLHPGTRPPLSPFKRPDNFHFLQLLFAIIIR